MPRRWRLGQPIEVLEGAELGRHAGVVGDVVAEVMQRRGIDGREPDGIHAREAGRQVVQPGQDPGQVADPVAVAVGEAARIDLVDDRTVLHHRAVANASPVTVGIVRGEELASEVTRPRTMIR